MMKTSCQHKLGHRQLIMQTWFKLLSGLSAFDRAAGMGSSWGGVCPRSGPTAGGGSGLGETATSLSSSNAWLFLREVKFDKMTFSLKSLVKVHLLKLSLWRNYDVKIVRNPNLWNLNAASVWILHELQLVWTAVTFARVSFPRLFDLNFKHRARIRTMEG